LSGAAHAVPAAVSGVHPQKPLSRAHQPVTAAINQVFEVFQSSYAQARGTYFASIENQANPSLATINAFAVYTKEQVSLLAQQTLNVFVQASRPPGGTRALKRLVASRIIGPQDQMPPGSLAAALLESIPQAGTTAPTASLYALSQDTAIESARIAILNGVNHS
jgi:hypothetical protein